MKNNQRKALPSMNDMCAYVVVHDTIRRHVTNIYITNMKHKNQFFFNIKARSHTNVKPHASKSCMKDADAQKPENTANSINVRRKKK